jgi:hypothetical protein
MSNPKGRPQTAVIPLRANVATNRIHSLARSSENIKWSRHATERMAEREIFDADALRIMRTGEVIDAPELTEYGEWKCKIIKRLQGGRDAGVVVIFLRDGKLLVKTVEWEDRR